MAQKIKVSAFVNARKENVWDYFTLPEHITQWNAAIPEWQCPKAESDFREGGTFSYRMEAKDGSVGFDFSGEFIKIVTWNEIHYTLDDGRSVSVIFDESAKGTQITETFEAETNTPADMQQQGWQNILDNFKQYVEEN